MKNTIAHAVMATAIALAPIAFSTIAFSPIAHASPGAHGPNGEHLDGQTAATASGLARLPDGSVNVPKLAQRRMVIRTTMVQEDSHPRTVELNGRVAIDPNAGGRVQAPFAGRIVAGPAGLPVAGETVRKGQVLARLIPVASAVERGNQEAALADLRAMRGLAERRVVRLESLEGTVPAKEIDAARAELASIRGREKAIGASVAGVETVVSPASGVIASSNVLAGQIVEARDVLFDVVDPARLLVEATSTDVALAGQIGSASLASAKDVRLTLVGGGRSLRDGALPISFRAQGTALPLAVGQPVTVLLKLTTTVKGIALPAAALVRNPANETVVWVKSGAMRFIAQPVEAQALDAHTVVITKGLSPENRVVVSGASLINQIR
ncbi:efflux RND transporter periplasmic adaptor subunit [Pseudoduganella umbonata]|uniref:Biotin carboxyl carrier protein n=2 Tax=Pseudoduganella umbonata TaxID=864828 RepID=A0A7W5E8N5_9BURK|nr:biotin carboxyl carrier protein [Pseudoduganella umbonata]